MEERNIMQKINYNVSGFVVKKNPNPLDEDVFDGDEYGSDDGIVYQNSSYSDKFFNDDWGKN